MKKKLTKTAAIGAALVASAMLATVESTHANGQRYTSSVDKTQAHQPYEFRIVGAPSADNPLVVQLIDTNTGEAVKDAHISILRPTYLGLKAAPMFQNILMPLKPDGLGDYSYSGERLEQGERLILRGHVPGETSATWESIVVVD